MTRSVFHRHLFAIVCAVFFFRTVLYGAETKEPGNTNQSVIARTPQSRLLTNAEEVHWLTRQEAASGQHVLIHGVVTCVLPTFQAAVVQDNTSGIYIDYWNLGLDDPLRVGELLEVEGTTDPGKFAPLIRASRIARLGTRELPTPAHPYWDQLINGSLDTQFVEIEGVVTAVSTKGVTLLTHGGKIDVQVLGINGVALKLYEGALVRLRGCLFASWDPISHQVNVSEIRMFVPQVTVVEAPPADPFAVTPKRVWALLQFDPHASALRRVKVSGQIVHERNGEYYAMEGADGFRFIPKQGANLRVGDLVDVVGFLNLTGPSPVLQEALARKVGVAALPDARPLDEKNLFRPEYDAVRVSVQAVLLNLSRDGQTLELQTGLQRFVAHLGGDAATSSFADSTRARHSKQIDLPLGARLQLTGIYAGSGGNRTTGMDVANFELLLNSPSDIQVLKRPSFWTLQRLLVLVGALAGVLGFALFWIRLLHHKVQQRTAQLRKEIQDREKAEHQRALAQERARIARDLHDDLGSSLTEITMLATTGPGPKPPVGETIKRMDVIAGKSRTLVYALDEIVWAVDPERDTLASVARYLASYVEEYLAGLNVVCRVHIPNTFPDQVISGEVRHHLFLAVKEALNNAVRHGCASEVCFHVRVNENQLWILITDNGNGFDTFGRPNGHGLSNLRNRLEHLNGRCELDSAPGSGTTVSLQLPLTTPDNQP
ncbi:MAG TPA: sensor histidine kinase [Verrucomicrobiae bacterium]|nr:sensor histidine kinase [Verrucomicrobiae bacterium]